MNGRLLTAMICLTLATAAWSQQVADTRVRIFDSNVRSLKVAPASNMYLPPIVVMGSDDVINVNFDYMDLDVHYLRYSVMHCNANWQPSQLVASEYVSGFNEADITDYAQCDGTFARYYNYNFTVPNADMQLLKSGNYLLTVYEQDNPEKVLLQTRFAVSENAVKVYAQVTSRTDVDYNDRHQQVSFDVAYKQGVVQDPYNDLTAVVTQNSRTDNQVTLTRPMMASTGRVTYDHNRALIFDAGNEYRRIETVNIHSLNMGVEAMQYFEPYYHATLRVDEPRASSPYAYDQTQYGRFTIRDAENQDSQTQAEYVVTHFRLNTGGPLSGGTIHLQGEFTEGLPESATTMHYDTATGLYNCDLLLKQGAYNYQYLWVPDGSHTGLTGLIEGDKYQTVNEYVVSIYYRPSGARYDRLMGHGIVFSGK